MEALALIAIVAAAAVSAAVSQKWRNRFRRAASTIGLTPKEWESRAAGWLRGFPVEVWLEGADGHWTTVISVSGLPSDVRLQPRGRRSGRASRASRCFEIGDPRFDEAFLVSGDERKARAALDAGSRAFAQQLLKDVAGLRLEDGTCEVRLAGYVADAFTLGAQVSAVLSLAEGMFRGAAPTVRLYANAFDDAVPRVRENNLRVLLDCAGSSTRADAITRAMDHEQPELRLLAARAEGSLAWPVMVELGQSRFLAPELRRLAIEALPASTPREVRVSVALSAIGKPDTGLAAAAARLAGRSGTPGDRRVERGLISLLGRDDDSVRAAAIAALGRVGTARAVERLLPFTSGLLTSQTLKQRARAAVRAIQARLVNGEAGALTLSEVEGGEGRLSLAADSGALSLLQSPQLVEG